MRSRAAAALGAAPPHRCRPHPRRSAPPSVASSVARLFSRPWISFLPPSSVARLFSRPWISFFPTSVDAQSPSALPHLNSIVKTNISRVNLSRPSVDPQSPRFSSVVSCHLSRPLSRHPSHPLSRPSVAPLSRLPTAMPTRRGGPPRLWARRGLMTGFGPHQLPRPFESNPGRGPKASGGARLFVLKATQGQWIRGGGRGGGLPCQVSHCRSLRSHA